MNPCQLSLVEAIEHGVVGVQFGAQVCTAVLVPFEWWQRATVLRWRISSQWRLKLVQLSPRSIENLMTRPESLPLSLNDLFAAIPLDWREQSRGLSTESA
jgi:hypothetical protein